MSGPLREKKLENPEARINCFLYIYTHTHTHTHTHIYVVCIIYIKQFILASGFSNFFLMGGTRGVMVIIVGNGHGDTSSNPGRDWLPFT